MASPYDIAMIQSGDPEAQVGRAAGATMAGLEQFKTKKDIIKQLNDAYKAAQEKAKKKKGLYGLGGSLIGGLLGLGLGPVGAAIAAGLSAGVAEKYRQDIYDPTKELREAKEKFKGRAESEGLEGDIEQIDEALDDAVIADAVIGALSSAVLGGYKAPNVVGETATQAASESASQILDAGITQGGGIQGQNILDVVGNLADAGAGGESVQFALDIPLLENFTGLNINKIPGMDSFIESPIGQTSLGLLRFGGTPLLQDLMMQDFTAPQLATTSRFRGYGGY